jgi:hypothetical protein
MSCEHVFVPGSRKSSPYPCWCGRSFLGLEFIEKCAICHTERSLTKLVEPCMDCGEDLCHRCIHCKAVCSSCKQTICISCRVKCPFCYGGSYCRKCAKSTLEETCHDYPCCQNCMLKNPPCCFCGKACMIGVFLITCPICLRRGNRKCKNPDVSTCGFCAILFFKHEKMSLASLAKKVVLRHLFL